MNPQVTFEMPGSIAAAELVEDYSGQYGATKIVAYSSGNGTVTPYATPVYTGDPIRPTFEYRYSPSNTEPDTAVLRGYAKGAAAILGPGGQAFTLTLSADPKATASRRPGVDWNLGDDVACVIGPCDAFPAGYQRSGRVIAYERTESTVTPIFADPAVYVAPT